MEEPLVSVITCAHNEEKYVGKCLASVRRALKDIKGEIVFVADRCSDNTAEIAKRFNVEKLIIKTWRKWRSSYAESLQTGFLSSSGKYISIVDADIILPENFFRKMLPLIRGNIASVSAKVETYPSSLLNSIIYAWEKTYKITPFMREPRGAARIVRRDALCKINGFKDSMAPDTCIDLELRRKGYRSLYHDKVKVWHIREVTLRKVVNAQISSGFARYQLKVSFMRTLAHSIFRLRPLVICGWLMGWLKEGRIG